MREFFNAVAIVVTAIMLLGTAAHAFFANHGMLVSGATGPIPTGISPLSAGAADSTGPGATIVALFSVPMSDGSNFAGTIFNQDASGLTQMSGNSLVAKRQFVAGDDGSHNFSLQPCQNGLCAPRQTFTLTISPSSGAVLDNTIFTGSPPDRTDTLIANISGGGGGPYTIGGADAAKFKVVTSGQWIVSPTRVGPFLESNGSVASQAGGFNISINGTAFHLGDPPITLTGAIHHIAAGAGDQTAAINSAASSAASNDTIFLDAGAHSICGTVNLKAGQMIVSATLQNPMAGQTARANVDFCGSGLIAPTSNVTIYGLHMTNGLQFFIDGTTGFKMTNNIYDTMSDQWWGDQNDTNTVLSWNTFANANGANGPGNGSNSSNFLDTRNIYHNCIAECLGSGDAGANNDTHSFNYYDHLATSGCPSGCGIGGVEIANSNVTNQRGLVTIADNYCINQNPAAFCYSLVGAWTKLEIARNYCEPNTVNGGSCAIEWDVDNINTPTRGYALVHDNYLNGPNGCNGGVCIFGPYQDQASSPAPHTQEFGNRGPSGFETNGQGSAAMPTMSVIYTAGPGLDGSAPPFAAGASQ